MAGIIRGSAAVDARVSPDPGRPASESIESSEMEVTSLEAYAEVSRKSMEIPEVQDAMKGYHELIDEGRREIYNVED
jgi:hypothetical protein